MSDSAERTPNLSSETTRAKRASAGDRRATRRRTVKFVVVFSVSVFALLVGYNKAEKTKPNDWYLLQVARSTALLLKGVGYSCNVGTADRYAGQETQIRAAIEAWSRGEEPPANSPNSDSEAPLSTWEAWKYEALRDRNTVRRLERDLDALMNNTALSEADRAQRIEVARTQILLLKHRETGPLVSFTLKPGVARRLEDARARRAQVQADATLNDSERSARLAALDAEIAPLEERFQALQAEKAGRSRERDGVFFNFVVIPDCGAVQSMAIFFSAIIAFPARWWKRLIGALIGLPVLFWVNSFRLAFLAVIGAWDSGGARFKFAHEYVWQGIYIVFVVALWMGWVEFLVRRRT